MFNSMRAAYLPLIDALATVMSAEVDQVESYRRLARAVIAGKAEMARERAELLLAAATDSLLTMIDALEEQ